VAASWTFPAAEIRPLFLLTLENHPLPLKEETLAALAIDHVEDGRFTILPDQIDTVVGLFNLDRLFQLNLQEQTNQHPVHAPMAHNEDLLATVFLKDGLPKSSKPLAHVRVVLTARDPIGESIGSEALPFFPFPFIQAEQLLSFQDPESEFVKLGALPDR
jgi:hypothetical protein